MNYRDFFIPVTARMSSSCPNLSTSIDLISVWVVYSHPGPRHGPCNKQSVAPELSRCHKWKLDPIPAVATAHGHQTSKHRFRQLIYCGDEAGLPSRVDLHHKLCHLLAFLHSLSAVDTAGQEFTEKQARTYLSLKDSDWI